MYKPHFQPENHMHGDRIRKAKICQSFPHIPNCIEDLCLNNNVLHYTTINCINHSTLNHIDIDDNLVITNLTNKTYLKYEPLGNQS